MNQEELLATRYGKKPRNQKRDRVFGITVALVLLVSFLIWAIAVTAGNSGRPTGNLLNYSVTNDHQVEVELSADNHRNQDVTCQVEALAQDYSIVAYKEVIITKDQASVKTTLNTVHPAVSAVVKDCWFK